MTPSAETMQVHVVDDDPAALDSLHALLTAHRFETSAHESARDFLNAFDPEIPACILLDLRMPEMSGMELFQEIRLRGVGTPVIILTGHGDVPVAVAAMKAGAIDFIEKPGSEEQILAAISAAADLLANRPRAVLPAGVVADRLARLTVREREVLNHLVLGMTNKSIADELGISQRTVEIHRARIREKMEARGLSDLIRMMR